MKKKKTVEKTRDKQIVEIHIYIHPVPNYQVTTTNPTYYSPGQTGTGTGKSPWEPPYEVTC